MDGGHSMKAIVATGTSGPESLELREVPDPTPAPGEVLVRIHAAGLNFADVRAAQGKYPGGPVPPFIAGREYAGVIESTGERVMGYSQQNAFAEFIASPRNLLFPVPPKWD